VRGRLGVTCAVLPRAGLRVVTLVLLLLLAGQAARAADVPKSKEERLHALQALDWQRTPGRIAIPKTSATFDMPEGIWAVTGRDAERAHLLFQGVEKPGVCAVFAASNFTIYVIYKADGYIRMDDWSDVDPDALMREIVRSNRDTNQATKGLGMAEFSQEYWEISPQLNRDLAIAYWAVGFTYASQQQINIDAFRLGRYGVLRALIAMSKDDYEDNPAVVRLLENNIGYDRGARHEDHQAGDKIAPYGTVKMLMDAARF